MRGTRARLTTRAGARGRSRASVSTPAARRRSFWVVLVLAHRGGRVPLARADARPGGNGAAPLAPGRCSSGSIACPRGVAPHAGGPAVDGREIRRVAEGGPPRGRPGLIPPGR